MDSFYFPKVTGAQLNSAEHEILNAIEYKNIKKFRFFSGSDKHRMLFFLLINVKMPTRYKNLYYEFSAHMGAHIGMA